MKASTKFSKWRGGSLFVPSLAAAMWGVIFIAGNLIRPRECFSLPPTGVMAHQDVRPLESTERELGGGQAHNYQITLAADQFMHVVVEQRGIDVVVVLLGPDGKKLAEVDSPNGMQGPEPVTAVSEVAGNYRIEVRSLDKNATVGRYEIKVVELRNATPRDRTRVAAARISAEAGQLRAQKTAASLSQAIAKYEEALPLWRAADDHAQEARTLHGIGEIYSLLGENRKALDYYNQALPLRRAERDLYGEAETLNNMGAIYYALGEMAKAIEHFNQALPLVRAAMNRQGEAHTLTNLGLVYDGLGEKQKALDYYDQSLPILREIGDRNGEAATLSNVGLVYWSMGEQRRALEYYAQALTLCRELKERHGEAYTLNNMGAAYDSLGENRRAREHYEQSLPLFRQVGDKMGAARTLTNLGAVCSSLSEYQQALDFYHQALSALREAGDRNAEAATLNNIGFVYAGLGEDPRAVEYYNQALPIARAVGDPQTEANILNNLGAAYRRKEERQQALDYYNQALQIRRAVRSRAGEAQSLNNLGIVYQAMGEKLKALDHYQQALPLWRAAQSRQGEASTLHNLGAISASQGDREQAMAYFNQALQLRRAVEDRPGEVTTLYDLARLEKERGNAGASRDYLETALKIIESLRTRIADPQLRASYFATVRKHFEAYTDLLMRLHAERPAEGYAAAALQASERARARTLLEILVESRVDIRQGVEPALLERERSLQQLISAKADRQVRLLNRKHAPEQAAAAAKELESLAAEYWQVESQIRAASPRYAALTQPRLLTLAEIQRQALDNETMLLEYALGEERSFLWAVTKTSHSSFELPRRATIEEAAKRVYDLLTARAVAVANETEAQRQARFAKADAEYSKASMELSRMLLAPIASRLGKQRLLIVGDGGLQYIPFAALPKLETGGQGDRETRGQGDKERPRRAVRNQRSFTPLLVDHEIVTLPSASTLAVLRDETAKRKPAGKIAAVFADPVFDAADERVKRDPAAPGATGKTGDGAAQQVSLSQLAQTRAIRGVFDTGRPITRLRFTQLEAAAIEDLVPAGGRKVATGFDADYQTAVDPDLGNYRYVHFATHGLVNGEQPGLSGILLSLVDERGQPLERSLLGLGEIYNLKLSAEVVVLSACQTALGRDVKGEGLIGLTRGFMYAGAPRVIASLWSVDDQATAELMGRFYRGLLRQRLRPAAALRQAQIAMWRNKDWRPPYFWGAFTLQGEWK